MDDEGEHHTYESQSSNASRIWTESDSLLESWFLLTVPSDVYTREIRRIEIVAFTPIRIYLATPGVSLTAKSQYYYDIEELEFEVRKFWNKIFDWIFFFIL